MAMLSLCGGPRGSIFLAGARRGQKITHAASAWVWALAITHSSHKVRGQRNLLVKMRRRIPLSLFIRFYFAHNAPESHKSASHSAAAPSLQFSWHALLLQPGARSLSICINGQTSTRHLESLKNAALRALKILLGPARRRTRCKQPKRYQRRLFPCGLKKTCGAVSFLFWIDIIQQNTAVFDRF